MLFRSKPICYSLTSRFWPLAIPKLQAFVLEVDRLVLTKDGSLLALFRTVGATDGKARPARLGSFSRWQGAHYGSEC